MFSKRRFSTNGVDITGWVWVLDSLLSIEVTAVSADEMKVLMIESIVSILAEKSDVDISASERTEVTRDWIS
jgi:hypothetical protein